MAVGARALGKQSDRVALGQGPPHDVADPSGVEGRRAIDEDRAQRAAAPADQRPLTNVRLGNETTGLDGVEYQNVDVAEVVRDQQERFAGYRPLHLDVDAQRAADEARPEAEQELLGGAAKPPRSDADQMAETEHGPEHGGDQDQEKELADDAQAGHEGQPYLLPVKAPRCESRGLFSE